MILSRGVLALPDAPAAGTPLLSVTELAAQLKLSTKTVYVMARAGEIPSVRRKGKMRSPWRFELAAVLAALQHEKN